MQNGQSGSGQNGQSRRQNARARTQNSKNSKRNQAAGSRARSGTRSGTSASDSRDGLNRNTQNGQAAGRGTTRSSQFGFPNDVTGGNGSGSDQGADSNQPRGFNNSESDHSSQSQGDFPRDYDSGRSGRGFSDMPRARSNRSSGSNVHSPNSDESLTTDQHFGSDNQSTSADTQRRFSVSSTPDAPPQNRGGIDFGSQPRPSAEQREQSTGSPYLDALDNRNDIPGSGPNEDGTGAEDDDQSDDGSTTGTNGSGQSTGSPFLDALDSRNDVNTGGSTGSRQGGASTSRSRPVMRDSGSAGAISDRTRTGSGSVRQGSTSRFRESSSDRGNESSSTGSSSGQRSNRRQTSR